MKRKSLLLRFGVCLLCFVVVGMSVGVCSFINKKFVKGSGKVITEERMVSAFTHIEASDGITVYIEEGKSEKLKVCADDNLISYIETEVKGGKLVVEMKEGINVQSRATLEVYVKMERIDGLYARSGADIIGMTPFTVDNITLKVSSAGDIEIELLAQSINVSVSSGGDVKLKGKSEVLKASLSSGADLAALGLDVRSCEINLSSGADALVAVSEVISYSVTSGADLVCKGHPRVAKGHTSSGGNMKFK